jgi:hypothetical protein
MRILIGRSCGLTILFALVMGCIAVQPRVTQAQAPTSRPTSRPAAPTSRPSVRASVVLPKLEQAYQLIASAENGYQGHRDEAMKEIADCALLLGRKLTPPNPNQVQKLDLSDLQLRSVQMVLLEIGRSVPPGNNNAPLTAHLNAAISQLGESIAAHRAQSSAGSSAGTGAGSADSNSKPAAGSANRARGARGGGTRGPLVIDNPINSNMVEIGSLEDIYETLSFANHNYAGHRVKAMNAISRVVKALGATISGDGTGHEQQVVSDQQLHYAQFLLHQVCQSFSVNDPKAILDDLTTADKELTAALSVR